MADTTSLRIKLFDGQRRLVDPAIEPYVRVFDNDTPSRKLGDQYKKANSFFFPDLPFTNNFVDNFRVIATADNHYDTGYFPVKMPKNQVRELNLMLLPKSHKFDFSAAQWERLENSRPELFKVLHDSTNEAADRVRYEQLRDSEPSALAGLLNITSALDELKLPRDSDKSALSYFTSMIWDKAADEAPAQDRLYAWASTELLDRVVEAADEGYFGREPLAGLVHHGASRSYKYKAFGEANIQITFHENAPAPEGMVKVEADLDYYKNLAAHALLEVIPNKFKGKTNPVQAFALRWIATREHGLPDFDPLYTIVNA